MKYRQMGNWGNALAILITFVLCGLWHGASWMFLFWGLLHGFYMAVSLFVQKPKMKLYKKLGIANSKLLKIGKIVVTFHLLAVSWVFFKVDSFEAAFNIFSQIFNYFKPDIIFQFIDGYTPTFLLILAGYIMHFLPRSLEGKTADLLAKQPIVIQAAILAVVIWFCAQIQSAELQPFIYFQF